MRKEERRALGGGGGGGRAGGHEVMIPTIMGRRCGICRSGVGLLYLRTDKQASEGA